MENISKKVLVCENGKKIGYVLDIVLDQDLKKIGYYIVDEESETECLIRNESVLSVGEEVVLISSLRDLEFVLERKPSLIGKEIYDAKGVSFGFVENLIFSKNRCEKVVTQLCEISSKNINQIGEDIIFVSQKRKKDKKNANFPRKEVDVKVEIQTTNNNFYPQKVNLSASFYIGKICCQDIIGYNNERIVAKGDKITKNIFENAKKHNKLNELFFAVGR